MNKLITKIVGAALGLTMAVGVGVAVGATTTNEPVAVHAAQGDTHDFSQSISQLLNNGASVSSISIADQGYTISFLT